MITVEETQLPGVGVRHDLESHSGRRVGILTHRDGRRDLFLCATDSPTLQTHAATLSEQEAELVSDLLSGVTITRRPTTLVQDVEGLAMDWLPVGESSRFAGHPLGETQMRTKSGVSIVAVIRGGHPHPAPGPEFVLEAGDTAVVVGTPDGLKLAAGLLNDA